jgi:hypothetical protein
MKNIPFLILFTLFIAASCDEESTSKAPQCINALIETQQNDIGAVYSYTYQGATVYDFNPKEPCCDFTNTIYATDCAVVCVLNGITGNQICNGDTFYVKATNKTLVWKRS